MKGMSGKTTTYHIQCNGQITEKSLKKYYNRIKEEVMLLEFSKVYTELNVQTKWGEKTVDPYLNTM